MAVAEAHAVVWDPLEVCVLVPGAGAVPASRDRVLEEVVAVLQDLGARRVWSGFHCFCGEPILLPAELTDHQQVG
ncbi:hypothetical protein [Streptacidiphilus jiangxiensis]|uniref:hypothetical protein n=1 Tax=Streptacidiphilus jiangxiensis TaxID=235985 RepID=UPI000A3DAD79|nr:hypothetical protein [Streptacidiphilus jiangxiensis]